MSIPALISTLQTLRTGQLNSEGCEAGWRMPVTMWQAPPYADLHAEVRDLSRNALVLWLSGGAQYLGHDGVVIGQAAPRHFSVHLVDPRTRLVSTDDVRLATFALSDEQLYSVAVALTGALIRPTELFEGQRLVQDDAALATMLVDYMQRAFSVEKPPTAFEMDSRANLIALGLVRDHSVLKRNTDRGEVRGGLASWQLNRCREAMVADLAKPASLQSLASMVGLSLFHFCRAFKQSTGLPPHRWLLEQRLFRAQELLVSTAVPIVEIAVAIGYQNAAPLVRLFLSKLGVSPATYRRSRTKCKRASSQSRGTHLAES